MTTMGWLLVFLPGTEDHHSTLGCYKEPSLGCSSVTLPTKQDNRQYPRTLPVPCSVMYSLVGGNTSPLLLKDPIGPGMAPMNLFCLFSLGFLPGLFKCCRPSDLSLASLAAHSATLSLRQKNSADPEVLAQKTKQQKEMALKSITFMLFAKLYHLDRN